MSTFSALSDLVATATLSARQTSLATVLSSPSSTSASTYHVNHPRNRKLRQHHLRRSVSSASLRLSRRCASQRDFGGRCPIPMRALQRRGSEKYVSDILDSLLGADACGRMQQDEEALREKLEQERLEEEEQQREAKRPRHHDLDLKTLAGELEPSELTSLTSSMKVTIDDPQARRVGSQDAFVYTDKKEKAAVDELKQKLGSMKLVARAKVSDTRIYCAAYHPEKTKDLIFFGGE